MCVCVFIKLHITAQSGLVILVILCHSRCVCVCVLSSHLCWTSDLWTHQPGSHRREVTHNFSTFFLRCLPQFLSREGFSSPFPSSTVKSNIVYPRINRSPLVGHDLFYFIFEEKSQRSSYLSYIFLTDIYPYWFWFCF